jgi:hypothetical protein
MVAGAPLTLTAPDTSSGISSWTVMEAIIENEALVELADVLEKLVAPDPVKGGRKRMYPVWMYLLYESLLNVWHSARRVDAELQHAVPWHWLMQQAATRFADRPELHLPESPMRRHHYYYFHNTYLADPEIQERWAEAHTRIAARQCQEIGLLDPEGAGTWTHPDRSRLLYGDGKVLTSRYRAHPGQAAAP